VLYRTTSVFDRVFGLVEGIADLPPLPDAGDAGELRERLHAFAAASRASRPSSSNSSNPACGTARRSWSGRSGARIGSC